MRVALTLIGMLFVMVLAGCIDPGSDAPTTDSDDPIHPPRDVTVVAVVDTGLNPYHWDFSSAHMPQHENDDPSDDLPLDEDPASWLAGHPGSDAFESHTKLDLTITPDDPDAVPDELYEEDKEEWDKVESSSAGEVNMHWVPDTKVIGFVNFGGGDGYYSSSHGTGVASVSVGNLHGSCPECLFVMVSGTGEQANNWVLEQDWIDVQTNSWGSSLVMRDRLYAGSDTDLQARSSERGQAVFFSAGNGQANTFTVPNPTLWSSQEGPDWIYTVGAIDPDEHRSYAGHGKPADVSSLGLNYPSMGGGSVNAESTFGGTSNATPVTAGTYARALWLVRQDMEAEREQSEGTLAVGGSGGSVAGSNITGCRETYPDCPLADGVLQVSEMREALFRSAEYAAEGWTASIEGIPVPVETDEMRLLAEGHGSFFGRMGDWQNESSKIADYVKGDWYEEQDEDQKDWMIALSWCRQQLWGEWEHGYWNPDVDLPEADPQWPLRTWLVEECPRSGKVVHDVVSEVNG